MSSARESRKHYRDRDALEPWLAVANLMPPETQLPEPSSLQPEGEHRKLLKELYGAFTARERQLVRGLFSKVSKDPRKRLVGALLGKRFRSGQDLYPLFHSARTAISAIADGVAQGALALGRQDTVPSVIELRLPPTTVLVFVNEDGTVSISQERDLYREFLDQLQGVELTRVRRCPVCRRFFWARRKDQPACSDRCGNVHRVRQYRAKQAEYAVNKRQNRHVKKARAEGRIFKNEQSI